MKKAYNHSLLVVLLAALTSVTPLAVDTYLPSMPDIAKHFGVSFDKIEITISIFLSFFATGLLVGGVLSDRLGRKKTALMGLAGFSLASFVLFLSTSLEMLYLFRAIQAFLGGLATVNSSATVRDLFKGKEAAKVFSTIASITMVAPMIAPAIGAFIISFAPWNYVFLFLALYALVVFIALLAKMPETGTKTKTSIKQAFLKVLTHKQAIVYILGLSLSFSGMFIFIGKSSFIYIEYFGLDKSVFPFFFGANVLVMIILTRLNIRLVNRYEPKNIFRFGIIVQFIAGLCLLGLSFAPSLLLVFIAMTIYVGILGLIFGNGVACALEFFPKDSGVANSVIGVTEFSIAGVVGFLASFVHTGELFAVFAMMVFSSFLALFVSSFKPSTVL